MKVRRLFAFVLLVSIVGVSATSALFHAQIDRPSWHEILVADTLGPSLNIYRLDSTGSQKRELVLPFEDIRAFSVAPDGRHIAFRRREGISLLDLQTQAIHHLVATDGAGLHWSHDSRWIAYAARPDNQTPQQVWLVDTWSGDVDQLTDADFLASPPRWSPVEDSMVFTATEPSSGRWSIYRLGMDRALRLLNADLGGAGLAWSPDGRMLAVGDDRDSAIYVFNLDDDNVHLLASQANPRAFDWSPDGKGLAFVSYEDDSLYYANLDHSGRRLLANQILNDGSPVKWSPDGQFILYTRMTEANTCTLEAVDLDRNSVFIDTMACGSAQYDWLN